MITRIDHRLLDAVSAAAAESPRQRKNYNFHPTDDFPAHRMLNALAPELRAAEVQADKAGKSA